MAKTPVLSGDQVRYLLVRVIDEAEKHNLTDVETAYKQLWASSHGPDALRPVTRNEIQYLREFLLVRAGNPINGRVSVDVARQVHDALEKAWHNSDRYRSM